MDPEGNSEFRKSNMKKVHQLTMENKNNSMGREKTAKSTVGKKYCGKSS